MNPDDAIRFLAHEAERCRDLAAQSQDRRDAAEALCLWLPPLLKVFKLGQPMDDFQALDFAQWFHKELRWRMEQQNNSAGASEESGTATPATEAPKLAPAVPSNILRAVVPRLLV
jgi:hypothetical protein